MRKFEGNAQGRGVLLEELHVGLRWIHVDASDTRVQHGRLVQVPHRHPNSHFVLKRDGAERRQESFNGHALCLSFKLALLHCIVTLDHEKLSALLFL